MANSVFKRWLLPAGLGTAVFAAGLWFVITQVKMPAPPPALREAAAPQVMLAARSEVNRELAMLTDLEPLFLPTPWNTSILELPPQTGREPGSMAFTFPPKWMVSESGGGVAIPEPVAVPKDPLAARFLGEAPNPMPEVARTDVPLPKLPARVAYIEVRRAESGALVFAETLPPGLDVKGLTADWVPLEFTVAVDTAGLVGEPQATRSSGSEEVEAYFRGVLTKQLQLGARLPPGFYTVAVGP